MFTWISDLPASARAAGLLLTFPLAGCLGEGTGGTGSLGLVSPPDEDAAEPLSERVLPRTSLYGGRVVVVPPDGYCVDGSGILKARDGHVVLIASCAILNGTGDGAVAPALMTVSVAPRQTGGSAPSSRALADVLAPADVSAAEEIDGVSLVRVNTGGDSLLPSGDPRYWRAGLTINDHVVSLAVYTPRGSATSGKALIKALAASIRTASPKGVLGLFAAGSPEPTEEN